MSSKKSYTSSSMISLKAELLKRTPPSASSTHISTKRLASTLLPSKKPKRGRQASPDRPTAAEEQTVLRKGQDGKLKEQSLDAELRKSQEALERKARLYDERLKQARDELVNGASAINEGGDEDGEDVELLDWKKRAVEFYERDQERERREREAQSRTFKTSINETPAIPTTTPEGISDNDNQVDEQDDPWVEHEDEFGRTRIIRKSQISLLEEQDEPAEPQPLPLPSAAIHPPGRQDSQSRRHYSSTSEIRHLGTGFYQFSTSSTTERLMQQEQLRKLNAETESGRTEASDRKKQREIQKAKRIQKLQNMRAKKFLSSIVLEGQDESGAQEDAPTSVELPE